MSFHNLIHVTDGKRIAFDVHDVHISIINAVRRIIMSDIPTIAFPFDVHDPERQGISVIKNTTSLHNEFIGHRVSLVPLMFDENETEDFVKGEVTFKLHVRNTGPNVTHVTTEHLRVYRRGVLEPDGIRDRLLPPCPITRRHILLHKLKPNLYALEDGQELELVCEPSLGTGSSHARWSPVSQCAPSFIVDEAAAQARRAQIEGDPDATPEQTLSRLKKFDTLERFRFFHKNVHEEAHRVHFRIESECGLRPTYLVFKALRLLHDTLRAFADQCVTSEGTILVAPIGDVPGFFSLQVRTVFFPLVNVLQCGIYDHHWRSSSAASPIDFIGYPDAHPLEDIMFLKVRFVKPCDERTCRRFMSGEALRIAEAVDGLLRAWTGFSGLGGASIREVDTYLTSV